MVKLSRIFILYIIAYLLVIWRVFPLCDKELINLDSMYKMTFLLLALAAFLLKSSRRSTVLILVLAVYIFMFYTAQFFLCLVAPEMASVGYRKFLSPETVSHAMTYVLLGTMAVGLGFVSGARIVIFRRTKKSKPKLLPFSPNKTLFLLFVSVGITFICVFIYRFVNPNLARSFGLGSSLFGFMTLFLNDAVMTLILFLVCVQKWEFIRSGLKIRILAGVSAVILLNFASGSRAGLVRPMLYLFFALFAVKGDFKVSKKLLMTFVLAVVISLAAFPFVTSVKKSWLSGVSVGDPSTFMEELYAGAEDLEYDTLVPLYSAANRLDGVAPITAILTIPPSYFRKFLTGVDQIKLLINKLVPFVDPFPGVVPSSRLFQVIIFDLSISEILANYQSRAYSLWGLCYAYFGWWGGLAAVYVMAFFLSALYQRVARTPSVYNVFLRGWVILFTYGWLRGFGFDVLIRNQYLVLATGLGFISIMYFIDRGKYMRSFKKRVPVGQGM